MAEKWYARAGLRDARREATLHVPSGIGEIIQMDDADLKKLLEELISDDPSATSTDIYSFISNHKHLTLTHYGAFINQFEDLFHVINTIVYLLNFVPKTEWKDHKTIQYLLYPEALKTLHCAFEIGLNGYYDESLMLVRSAYETFVRIVYVSCNPSDYDSIFVKIKDRPKFIVTNFVEDDLKVDWRWIYHLLSAVTHSKKHKAFSARKSLIEGPKKEIQLEYEFSEQGMHMFINLLTFVFACLFHAMRTIFDTDFPATKELADRVERVSKIDDLLLGIIEKNPSSKFGDIAKDLRKIGEIIRAADSGKDWSTI